MVVRLFLLVVTFIITPITVLPSLSRPFHVVVPGNVKIECTADRGDNPERLLPCAWREAQREFEQKYPELTRRVESLPRCRVSFRNGPWYDPKIDDYIDGDTFLNNDPPIKIGLTGDIPYDFGTEVHEYKHYIVDILRLGERAHDWVEQSDLNWGSNRTSRR